MTKTVNVDKLDLIINGNKMTVDLTTVEGRMAARAWAWTVLAQGDKATADAVFSRIGRTEDGQGRN